MTAPSSPSPTNTTAKAELANDVVVKSDGSIWFTDPPYGILIDYEGATFPSEQKGAPAASIASIRRTARSRWSPTISTSPTASPSHRREELYIVDTAPRHKKERQPPYPQVQVSADGKKLSGGKVFAKCTAACSRLPLRPRRPDLDQLPPTACIATTPTAPCRQDQDPGAGLHVCFGGPKLNRLFICGTTSLYSAYVAVNGVAPKWSK